MNILYLIFKLIYKKKQKKTIYKKQKVAHKQVKSNGVDKTSLQVKNEFRQILF